LSWPLAASAACPQGILDCDTHWTSGDELLTTDASAQQDCNTLHSTIHESFDHVAGRTDVEAMSVSGHWPTSILLDDYVLSGPPAGTALTITATFDLDLQHVRDPVQLTTAVGGELEYESPTGQIFVSEYSFTASAPGTETNTHQLRLDIAVRAGTSFQLRALTWVYTSGRNGGYARGRLAFEGLPPGSSVQSCKGFRQDQPTAALSASWGRMKALYR